MTPTDTTPERAPLGSSHAELIAEMAHRFAPSPAGPRSGRGRIEAGGRRTRPDPRPVLVAVAHGSRDPAARTTVARLLDRVRALRPGLDVRLAHLGLNEPLLDEVLDDLARDRAAVRTAGRAAVLVPVLLGRGYHVRHDLPAALARHPRLDASVAAPLGPHPLLADALRQRLAEAGWDDPEVGRVRRREARDAVVLAAAGSKDPASARDAQTQALLLAARLHAPVVPAYVSAAAPTVAQAVAVLRERGYRRIALSSYFTAPGDFARLAAADAPWLVAAPLGAAETVAELLLQRYDAALPARTAVAAAV
ncbi:sirohydrochlorin chelatase [Streptacidiphilus sp. N1-12]|uniref:Sirohydrochlorin chelatase n=2 Tax=Streptacidiphilus alkalitolerans TaxID=3342712 RepID=A0ABV6WUF6_9ACTN